MVNNTNVRLALRERLLTVPSLPDKRSWENVEFTPPDDADWLRETYTPGAEAQVSSNMTELTGFVQYDLFTRPGGGTNTIEAIADAIKEAFHPKLYLLSGVIHISRSDVLPGRVDGGWFHMGTRVYFRAYATIN